MSAGLSFDDIRKTRLDYQAGIGVSTRSLPMLKRTQVLRYC